MTTEEELRQLREGDRLKYHGVQWHVNDYSTYTDDNGYETEEWLLRSQTGKEYYLMREVDPQSRQSHLHWYIAEELDSPTIYEPGGSKDLTYDLADKMRSHATPYPELRLFNRTYRFESETEGDYESDGHSRTRITWDYWDPTHLWNLALETWTHGGLTVYSTREVQPADFTDLQTGGGGLPLGIGRSAPAIGVGQSFNSTYSSYSSPSSSFGGGLSLNRKRLIGWIIVVIGFLFMISGI